MRSALYIGSKQNIPLTRTQIPSCGSPNGMPFCFEYSGDVTQWQLVKDGEEYGYDLDVSWLANDGKYIYYNGDVDLLEYLTSLGYDARAGRYYYSFRLDGVIEPDYDSVLITSNNTIGVKSGIEDKAYGEWDFDIEYRSNDGGIYPNVNISFISSSTLLSIYNIKIDEYIEFSKASQFEPPIGIERVILFKTENNIIDDGGDRFKLSVKRNETLNQYFTGSADSFAFFINDIIIDDSSATIGSNPITDSSYTSGGNIIFGGSENIEIYNFYDNFSIISGSVDYLYYPQKYTGGTIKQSNLFQLECEDTRPVTPGDFNNDFNNDFF